LNATNIDPVRAKALGEAYDQALDEHRAAQSVVIQAARELERVIDDNATRLLPDAIRAVRRAARAERLASNRLGAATQELVLLADESDEINPLPNLKETR
jgi:hypothetical protein